jgi:hypothetical protein
MATDFKAAADAVLNRVVKSEPRVPGVVAMVTDPHRNIYEGAAGKRRVDGDADMTTDTVFGIFSTTKAHARKGLGLAGILVRGTIACLVAQQVWLLPGRVRSAVPPPG